MKFMKTPSPSSQPLKSSVSSEPRLEDLQMETTKPQQSLTPSPLTSMEESNTEIAFMPSEIKEVADHAGPSLPLKLSQIESVLPVETKTPSSLQSI